jgi:hypothetical protein
MNGNAPSLARRAALASGLALTLLIGVAASRARGDDAPPAVRFTATAVDGTAVVVPDAAHPTVLLFILAGQPQSTEAIPVLRDVTGKTPDARVFTVVGGADAAAQARQLAVEKHAWPTILDADHALSGKLGVHAWPTTVVVSPAGVRVGHVAGQPKAYARNVEAFLDFAAGRSDRATLEQRLNGHEAVLDSPEQMAARHVQVASRLLQKGLVEQSRAELARAVALRPNDPAVAFGSNDNQTVKAVAEAESYPGPSLVIAYSHSIAHGYDLRHGLDQQKLAVDSGVWPLYRYDPRLAAKGLSPLQLDSPPTHRLVQDYLRNESRFSTGDADLDHLRSLSQTSKRNVAERLAIYKAMRQTEAHRA